MLFQLINIISNMLIHVNMEKKLTVCESWEETPPSPWQVVDAQSHASSPPLRRKSSPVGVKEKD